MSVHLVACLDDLDAVMWAIRNKLEVDGTQSVAIENADNKAKMRSLKQNALAFKWQKFLSETRKDDTPEGYRAYCKLHFGVAIRKEDAKFCEVYDRVIRPLSYEHKLEIMVDPINFPVTRDMSVKEFARYLEAIEVHFAKQGIILPTPEDLYHTALMKDK